VQATGKAFEVRYVRGLASGIENAKAGSRGIAAREAMEARTDQHSLASCQRARHQRIVILENDLPHAPYHRGRRRFQNVGFGALRVDFDELDWAGAARNILSAFVERP